eukprot:GHUV01033927.1.p2 GENE.GHUV01033927.1~~GHUV01033927.1.p2  ORF type:complete len:103 (+),score=8.51 GHUV01033927.1:379-687(+)
MAFSSVLRKFASVSLMTSRPASFSMFLTHLLARPWGSIHRGQRRPAQHNRCAYDSPYEQAHEMGSCWQLSTLYQRSRVHIDTVNISDGYLRSTSMKARWNAA